jgi:DNA-binding response OmpR family regulator
LANLFAKALTDADYEVEIVEDGQAALVRLQHDKVPDLLLLDLNIPNVSGEKVLANIRSDERFEGMRILVISGNATRAGQIRDKADLVLHKPIEFDELRRISRIFHPDYRSTNIFSNRQKPSGYKFHLINNTI